MTTGYILETFRRLAQLIAKVECRRKNSQRLTPKNFISLNGAASKKKKGASEKSTSEHIEEREEAIV